MLRLLGVIFLGIVCLSAGPWGLLVGAILILLGHFNETVRVRKVGSASEGCLSAVPLCNAVYCANCEVITNSPHDSCSVCGSHSVVGVSRMLTRRGWRHAGAKTPAKAAKYKLNLIAEVREIPADGLNETADLITRLAEAGGDVRCLHVNVEPNFGQAVLLDRFSEKTFSSTVPLTRPASAFCRTARAFPEFGCKQGS
jgi:hypothetical protein